MITAIMIPIIVRVMCARDVVKIAAGIGNVGKEKNDRDFY